MFEIFPSLPLYAGLFIFGHVMVFAVQVGSGTSVVPPATSLGLRTVEFTVVIVSFFRAELRSDIV